MTSENTARNILLTGLPRSGTTLVCHLLNKLPDSVALHEPMQPMAFRPLDDQSRLRAIGDFFSAQRAMIRETGTARSKSAGGGVPDNHLGELMPDGTRRRKLDGTAIRVTNVTGDGYRLYIKHPSFFTALLPLLVQGFQCYASVRNPLSVILSWRNAGMAVSDGRVPAAEAFDERLQHGLDSQPDVLSRQLFLLDYFFDRYHRYLPTRTIRYEDVVNSRGKALSRLDPAAQSLDEPLSSRNALALRTDRLASRIAETILERHEAAWWRFYSRQDVENLVTGLEQARN